MDGVALWNQFVAQGAIDAGAIAEALAVLPVGTELPDEVRARLGATAHSAFDLAMQAVLVGADPVGRLALAIEKVITGFLAGQVAFEGLPFLASSADTLRRAFVMLASPDKSGARIEGLPVEAARFELESLLPVPGQRRVGPGGPDVPVGSLRRPGPTLAPPIAGAAEPVAQPTAAAPVGDGFRWSPSVDDDMIELFFAEVDERIDGLAGKLVEIEGRPDDGELLRDVFRDLHTLKGSSAMVGLKPMNDLAHAAEDLVGQLRDGTRRVDAAVIDALLAALDALRVVAARASRRDPIAAAPELVARLHDPRVAVRAAPAPAAEPVAEPDGRASAEARARQTIRVDFDKLDRLLNLVGELVLGRDGLRGSIGALGALSGDLAGDRQLARRLDLMARPRGRLGPGPEPSAAPPVAALTELRDELGRVERVLGDITHELDHSSGRLDAVSSQLRDAVMKLRMVPVGGVLRKHHRTVRDLGQALGKQVRLAVTGEDTELDKLLVEALDDPLMHLVRNAVDHGIEAADVRGRAGKPAEGTIRLSAAQRGNHVEIRIADDGRGLDPVALKARALERGLISDDEAELMSDAAAFDLIFRPGFSTAQVVSEVSGRGVGMDVVRQVIVKQLKGTIEIQSQVGRGTELVLGLPLTLAIIQVLLCRVGGEVLAVPLDAVVRTLVCAPTDLARVQDREVLAIQRHPVPLIRLAEVLELGSQRGDGDELHVILTEHAGEPFGLIVEGLVAKREIVIKPLGELLRGVPCAAGATLLGDRCAVIVDVPALIERALRRPSGAPRVAGPLVAATATATQVLLVEDSDVMREGLRRLLSEAGYQVTVARDGVEGLELARTRRFDLVSTDVMMPRMDGYELTRALRATADYRDVPIVMVTSRAERIDRVRGFDAGVDEYITKPHDRHELVEVVARLLAERRPS